MRVALLLVCALLLSGQAVLSSSTGTDITPLATLTAMPESVRQSTPVEPAVPTSPMWILDADNVDNSNNSTRTDGTNSGAWKNAGTATNIGTAGTATLRKDRLGTHDVQLFSGAASGLSLSSLALSTYSFIQNTGVFDIVVYLRRDVDRAVSVMGNSAQNSRKGFSIKLSASGQVIVGIYNGTAPIVTMTTTATVPLLTYTPVRVSGDGTSVSVQVSDGAAETTAFTGALSTGDSTVGTALGAVFGDGDAVIFNGAMAWVGLYTRTLTTTEWAGLRSFFVSRYGAQTQQAAYACLGDSLTQGFQISFPFPLKVGFITPETPIVANHGVAGNTASQARTRWTTLIRGKGYSRLVVSVGINDIRTGTVGSNATAFSSIQSTLSEAIADGLNPVVLTVTPGNGYTGGGWNAQATTELLALNTSLRNYAATNGLALVDAWELLKDPADSTSLNPTYRQGDLLHWNQAGADVVATAVKTALGL